MTTGTLSDTGAPASASSFFWPMRLLPPSRRHAAFAVYAFCRAVDDIADGDNPAAGNDPAQQRTALAGWRRVIDGLYGLGDGDGDGNDPAAVVPTAALRAAVTDFGLPRDAFIAVLDGMAMDVDGPIVAPDMATLELYCGRVAGAVGRLLVRIFVPAGRLEAGHDAFAVVLGEALQLTNILRDVDEDAAMGRLYLPREALLAGGIDAPPRTAAAAVTDPRFAAAWDWLAARAAARFAEAERRLAALPPHGLWPAAAMMAVYHRLLRRLIARGWQPGQPRLKLGRWEALAVTAAAVPGLWTGGR